MTTFAEMHDPTNPTTGWARWLAADARARTAEARLAEALWLVENGTPHDRMISAGRWDEWLNRRNAILGWADDSGRTADQ